MTRICPKCKRELPLTSEYFCRSKREKYGFVYSCKKCIYADKKRYYKTEQGKAARKRRRQKYRSTAEGREKHREEMLRYRHGITLEEYNRLFEQQNGLCAICEGVNVDGRGLAVDHNHQTGKVRGLLCFDCNLLLGRLENLPKAINKVKQYLINVDPNSALLLDMGEPNGVINCVSNHI